MFGRERTEDTCRDLLLSVLIEDRVLNQSVHVIIAKGSAFDGNMLLTLECDHLLLGDILSNGYRKKMALSDPISEGLHLNDFEELHFIHELLQRVGPTLTKGLEVLNLLNVDVN